MTVTKPERTLFLLVTCSRDVSRRDMAIVSTKNVVDGLSAMGIENRLVVFDNASTYREHLELLPQGVRLCMSAENLGYWTAIKWILDNISRLADFKCDFIYLVESDLVHSGFSELGRCEAFLDNQPMASAVRTQEFSVNHRWRYNKRLHFLPFHVERSQVSLSNAITGEKAVFERVQSFPGIYLSNLHPKLPALQRVDLLSRVFRRLAEMRNFTEKDYFAESMKIRPKIGVLDGGLYHALTSRSDRRKVISGSYASVNKLEEIGYLQTRICKIDDVSLSKVDFDVVGS